LFRCQCGFGGREAVGVVPAAIAVKAFNIRRARGLFDANRA